MFTKKDLKDGMFGKMDVDGIALKFVLVKGLIVYQSGAYDYISELSDTMHNNYDEDEYIEELRWAKSFDDYEEGELIFDRSKDYKPILMSKALGECYGVVGTDTNLTCAFGEKLFVGDVVEIYNVEQNESEGKAFVVSHGNECFIMGLGGMEVVNGNVFYEDSKSMPFQIRLVRSYGNVIDGETYGALTAIREA